MNQPYRLTGAIFLAFLAWFTMLSAMRIPFGILGLGCLMLIGGIWLMFNAKSIFEQSQKEYRKLPKSKRKSWNKPSQAYYYFNLFVVIPAMITAGILCFYMVWFLG